MQQQFCIDVIQLPISGMAANQRRIYGREISGITNVLAGTAAATL